MTTRKILVTGATGKQGGAVINALLESPPSFPHEIIALTRNPTSATAKKLESKPNVSLLQGDFDDCDAIFTKAGGKGAIWGVFSVQVPQIGKQKEGLENSEVKAGCALVDAAVANGVSHFVYSGVGDGGPGSRDKEPKVPHFVSKFKIEDHLKSKAGIAMTWTILQPVAFMENAQPGMFGGLFAAMWDRVGDKKLQLVSIKDIGIFAALSFADVEKFKGRSIILVGDELTRKEGDEIYWKEMGRAMPRSYSFLVSLLFYMVPEMAIMFKWFKEIGCKGSVEECKQYNAKMLDFGTWLREESDHKSWRTEKK